TQSGTMKRLTSDVLALHMLTSGKTGSTSFYRADSLLVGRCARAAPRHFPDQLLRGNRPAPRELIAMAHPDVMCPSRKKEDGIREVRGTGSSEVHRLAAPRRRSSGRSLASSRAAAP